MSITSTTGIAVNLQQLKDQISGFEGTLVAVSKTHAAEKIEEAYEAGQRHFGENKVQEMVDKAQALPKDIQWHFIGHLQRNKVKYIVDFVHLIHSVDSDRLWKEVEKQAAKKETTVDVLLQMHISQDEAKFGFSQEELNAVLEEGQWKERTHVRVRGLMGMATFTEDEAQIHKEFSGLRDYFHQLKEGPFAGDEHFTELSMGMSGDYPLAIEEGSTMIRVGSKIFGARN